MPTPQSQAPPPPLERQEFSEDRGAEEPIPIRASSDALGPPTAPLSPRPPAEPPRSRTTQEAGQEPESPPLAAQGPSPATGNPDSPGATPGGQPEAPQPADRKLCPSSVDAPPLPEGAACASLQEATRLIQEEFAFDGYLDRGLEALIMGTKGHGPGAGVGTQGWGRSPWSPTPRCGPARAEQEEGPRPTSPRTRKIAHSVLTLPSANAGEYIYALKDLTYATFCGAISEKFCDLYWGERLLQSLFNVVNGRTPPSGK